MNIQSIVVTNCIGMFLALAVLNISSMDRKGNDLDSRLLTALLLISFSCCLMEMISFIVDGYPFPICRVMVLVSNTWIYLGNPLLSTLWVMYVDYHLYRKAKRLMTLYRPHMILLAISWIAVLGNIFGRYLFYIDEQNAYHRLPASYSLYIVTFLMIAQSTYVVIKYKRTHRVEIFFPIWIFLTPVLIALVFQTMFYGVSLTWCCTSIGLAALYMSTQTELAYRDPLTGLYNRHFLDRVLNTWTGRSGIMMDMDYFKDINDRFGHSAGDEALRETATLLLEVAPEGSIATRFAGDEFILLLTTTEEEKIKEAEDRIRAAVNTFNQTSGRPYTISLSMGHAVFDMKDKDGFMEAIDNAMYREKQARHASGKLKDRRRNPR